MREIFADLAKTFFQILVVEEEGVIEAHELLDEVALSNQSCTICCLTLCHVVVLSQLKGFRHPHSSHLFQHTARRLLQCLPYIDQIRSLVLDLRRLRDEWEDTTTQWLQTACTLPITHSPLRKCLCYATLLRKLQYPEMDNLSHELHNGFRLLGKLPVGAGWTHRHDHRYSDPTPMEQFMEDNRRHIFQKLKDHKVDPNWDSMLQELLTERGQGKIIGPFQAFTDWPNQCTNVPSRADISLLPNQWQHCPTAVCFSVVQADKIRRCEDFRRGAHNSTVGATSKPTPAWQRGSWNRDTPHTYGHTTSSLPTASFPLPNPGKASPCCSHHRDPPCGNTRL